MRIPSENTSGQAGVESAFILTTFVPKKQKIYSSNLLAIIAKKNLICNFRAVV